MRPPTAALTGRSSTADATVTPRRSHPSGGAFPSLVPPITDQARHHGHMPHRILQYPFSITPAGNAAVIPQGGEQEAGQTILVIVSTVLGERPMAASFGIPDPAFVGLETADVATVLNDYNLTHIEVQEVSVEWPQESVQQAEVRWRLAEVEPTDGDELGEGYDEE